MENRFGFKELVVTVLLVGVMVMIGFAMVQYDRQWDQLETIHHDLQSQGEQLRKVSDLLAKGVAFAPATTQGGTAATQPATSQADAATDPFYRLRQAQAVQGYTRGGWYIASLHNAPGQLTALVTHDVYAANIQNYVLESLAQRDPDTLDWRPLIAQSWHTSDDGLTITFQLRRDVTFSDGEPLTAKDVAFTYNLMMNPRLGDPSLKTYYSRISSVTATGPYTVVFKLSEPYFKSFDLCAGMQVLPEHFYGKYTPEQINQAPGLLMGTGPYQLQEGPSGWSSGGSQIVLVRNANYWGVQPGFDRIIYKIISDDTAQLTAFTNGQLDIFSPQPEQYQQLQSNPAVKKQANLFTFRTIMDGYRYVGWNEQRDGKPTRFADKRVRQAMTMLLDRQRMANRLMEGLSTVVTGPFSPMSEQYDHSIKPWPHDPARAKALLKEAGYHDRDGDGVIDGPDGKPFQFELIYPSGLATYQHMVLYLKDAYARAGIILKPSPLPFPVMIQRMQSRDFDAITLGWSGGIESDPYQIFDSSQVHEGGDDYVHYINHDLDRIIEKARATMDKSQRMKMWHEVHRILHEDQPYTFLFTTKNIVFVSKRMRNVKMTHWMGLNPRTEWFIPRAAQKWEK